MKAVLLAAGRGTRLLPLTRHIQKTLLPVAGRPILEHNLIALRDVGIRDVIIVVNYLAEQIKSHFGDGSQLGISIEYVTQPKLLGTADAVRWVRDLVKGPFLVSNADELTDAKSFGDFISNPVPKVGVRCVKNPQLYGVVEEKDGRLMRIIEKPPKPPTNRINAGLYILPDDIFEYIERIEPSPRGEYEITDAINAAVADGIEFGVEELSGLRYDIGTPWAYLEANEMLMRRIDKNIEGQIENGVTLKGKVHVGSGTIIKSGTYIEGPVWIGSECEIGPHAYVRPYTTIMDGCRIGRAEIKNCIILEGVKIPHCAYVGDSIIGPGVNVSAGCVLANVRHDKQNVLMTINGKVYDTGRRKMGAVVGANTQFGINTSVMPGTVIDADLWLKPGAILDKTVTAEHSAVVRISKKK